MAKVLPQYAAGLTASMFAFAAGCPLGWANPAQKTITSGEAYGFGVSDIEYSWVGSLVMLGATFSCIPAGILINIIGRKPTMLLLIIPFMIGWGCVFMASNVMMLCAGRFVLGMCAGAVCVTAPMYATEIAQDEVRGTLGSFFQLLLCSGVTYSYIVGAFMDVKKLNIACGILPVIIFLLMIPMPESPVYLVAKGNAEKAMSSLQWLRGKDFDSTAELNQIKASDAKSKEGEVSFFSAMTRPVILKALGLSMALMFFQQLSGINAVVFYSTEIFSAATSSISASLCTIIVGVMMTLATVVSVLFVDKLGRRLLLMTSSLFMAIATFLLGLYFFMKTQDESSVKTLGWLPLGSVCLYIIMFSFGYGPVPWLIMAEIFPPDVKGVAGSISGASNWGMAFIVTKTYVIMRDTLGVGQTFWLFTAISIIGLVFVLILLPETKGKSTAEIQEMLSGGSAPPAK